MEVLDPWLPVLRARRALPETLPGGDDVAAVSFNIDGDEFALLARADAPEFLALQMERPFPLAIPWREGVDLACFMNEECWLGPMVMMKSELHPSVTIESLDKDLRPHERDARQASAWERIDKFDREHIAVGACIRITWIAPSREVDPDALDLAMEKLRWAARDLAEAIEERWPAPQTRLDA